MKHKSGHIYIVTGFNNLLKIGYSKYPESRCIALNYEYNTRGLQLYWYSSLSLYAFQAEKMVHVALHKYTIGNELFNIDPLFARGIIEEAIKGFETNREFGDLARRHRRRGALGPRAM